MGKADAEVLVTPAAFSGWLSTEDFRQLDEALGQFLDIVQKGFLSCLFKNKILTRCIELITRVGGFTDTSETQKSLTAAALICAGAKSPEDIRNSVQKAILQGVGTTWDNLSPEIQHKLLVVMLYAQKIWAKKCSMAPATPV